MIKMIPDDFTIITGHGELSHVDDIRQYRIFYAELIQTLSERLDKGLSDEEAAALGFPESWREWLTPELFENSDAWLEHTARWLSEASTKQQRNIQ